MPSTFYETNCDLVLVKNEGGMFSLDTSGVKQRFLLYLNMSYSGMLGSMTAFRADLRDAVALAFQVRLAFQGSALRVRLAFKYLHGLPYLGIQCFRMGTEDC